MSKVVSFPRPAESGPPPEKPARAERSPYINLREGIFPMAGLPAPQQERLWRLWDLLHHLKRACTNATFEEDHTRALEAALHNLMNQLNYKVPQDETDPN